MQLLVAQGCVSYAGDQQKGKEEGFSRLQEVFPTPVPLNRTGGGCLRFPHAVQQK